MICIWNCTDKETACKGYCKRGEEESRKIAERKAVGIDVFGVDNSSAALMRDLQAVIQRHTQTIGYKGHVLAVVAQLVGMLLAMVDKEKVSPHMARKLVRANIARGNLAAVRQWELRQK
jgi:hypothetical protein